MSARGSRPPPRWRRRAFRGCRWRRRSLRFAPAALVVVGAGAWLPFIATDLALAIRWHNSFVGTLLVAAVSSLPELVVTLAALRIGAVDMAIANLLGSNLFDLMILAIDDLFWRPGPLLDAVPRRYTRYRPRRRCS